ncbi:MAG: TonB-dependent receptor [Hyphomonadaceae bacterium]
MKRFGNSARLALLLAGVCAAPMALCAPAWAQEADEEEIVVTARRTAESLQEVPASVSAFSEAQMERLGATDATGLQGAVPNLNIVQGRGSSNATNIYIRGVGQPDALQTFDPAVGFYVDGVYYSRIRGTQMELFDIERVEVLRGPQGTLYGKNTIGGAYSVITHRPGQDVRGLAQFTLGDYGLMETRLAASGPLSDTFAIGGALFGTTRDGYVTNPVTGEDYNDRNAWGGRFAAAWDVTPNFSLDFSADYSEEDNALTMGQPVSTLVSFAGAMPIGIVPDPAPEFDFTAQATPGLPNSSTMEHSGVSLRASWDLGNNWTINSITAARDLTYDDYVDIDATQFEFGDVFVGVDQDQISQELQAVYEGERLTLFSGLYYLRENVGSHQEAYGDDLVNGYFGQSSFLRTIDDDLETTSMAIYANASFALTDRLNLGVGARYTKEEKDYFRTTSTFWTSPGFNSTVAFTINDTWDNFSPMVSLDYQLQDNVLIYGRVAQGFKSGGFNGRANNLGEQAPYEQETVTSYEIGAKTDWMDGRLIANFAAFYNDYEDFQARVSGTIIDPILMVPTPSLTVLNAGQLEISGAELELVYRATDALRLDAQIGYLDASYGEFDDDRFVAFGGSRAFQEPAFSPDWTARFGGYYTIDLSTGGSIELAGSARFRSRMALAVDNTLINSAAEISGLFQDDYWLYDASVTWRANDIFSIALQGRNLSDEVYKTDGQEFSSVGNIRTVYYGAPRTVNVVFTARY